MTLPRRPVRLGIVSDRRRLSAAAGRPAEDGDELLVEQVLAAADGGVDFFQLREPDLGAARLVALAGRLLEQARGRLAILVNDRADVAVAAGAGLHLKATSMPAARLRSWLPPGTRLMRAVHGVAAMRGAGPIDAALAGTVAASPSKPAGSPTLGAAGLARIVAAAAVPVYAIGGLGSGDWPWVARTGACGCAGIGVFLPRRGESAGDAVHRAVDAFARGVD